MALIKEKGAPFVALIGGKGVRFGATQKKERVLALIKEKGAPFVALL